MNILLFIFIAIMFLVQIFNNCLSTKMSHLTDIIGDVHGTLYYIAGICAIAFAIIILYKSIKNKEIKLEKWDICFLLLLGWGFLSVLFAEDKTLAIFGTHRIDGYFSYLVYASLYIGTRTLKSEKIKLWLIRFFTIVITFLCFDCIVLKDNTSIFYNRNHFAYLLTISSMLLCGLLIYEKKLYFKLIYCALFCCNVYTLILADTFGSYLAVMFGVLFVLLLTHIAQKNLFKSALLALLLFICVSIFADYNTGILRNNFNLFGLDIEKVTTNADDVDSAGSFRIGLWKYSISCIAKRPVFGYGPEGTYYSFYSVNDCYFDRPHNEYIQYALFMGIPALIFYLTGLFSLFIFTMKNLKRIPSYAFLSGIAVLAYCISAFFGNTMYYTSPYFFMFLGMLSKPFISKSHE